MIHVSLHTSQRGLALFRINEPGPAFNLSPLFEVELMIPESYLAEWDFFRLNGRTFQDTKGIMELGIQGRGTHYDQDFFTPSPGNVGHTLSLLLKWGKRNPSCVWRIEKWKGRAA